MLTGYESLDDGSTGKQLFLCSLIRSDNLRDVITAIVEGGYEFSYFFEYREIYLISDCIALCAPADVRMDVIYGDDDSFTNDLSVVHLILFLGTVEEQLNGGSEPREGDEWEDGED